MSRFNHQQGLDLLGAMMAPIPPRTAATPLVPPVVKLPVRRFTIPGPPGGLFQPRRPFAAPPPAAEEAVDWGPWGGMDAGAATAAMDAADAGGTGEVNEEDLVRDTDMPEGGEIEDLFREEEEAEEETLGFDIATEARRFNALKNFTAATASILLRGGLEAIDRAIDTGSADREQRRKNVRGHLEWHQAELKKYKPEVPYPPGEDLKKWVVESMIESNIADEAATWRTLGWMWQEIGRNLGDLADRAASKVSWWLSPPWWVWALGLLAVGTVGYGLYRIVFAAAPGAGAALVGRYLPARRDT